MRRADGDYAAVQSGARDCRMVVPAAVAWAASAACQAWGVAKGALVGLGCCVAALACMAVYVQARGYRPCHAGGVGIVAVCCVTMLCALASAQFASVMQTSDAVNALMEPGMAESAADAGPVAGSGAAVGTAGNGTAARVSGKSTVRGAVVVLRVTAPAQASVRRGFVCSVQARASGITVDGVSEGSAAQVTVWADERGCQAASGAMYRVQGTLATPSWGGDAAWLEATETDAWAMIRAPNAAQWASARMQRDFLGVTARLSDQGRVLVPGLTLGVMGQHSSVDALAGQNAVDSVYAAGLVDRFRNAGIMHLMAVSGGHFVLVAAFVGMLLRRCLASRRVVAVVTVGAYAVLVAVLFPSDSVTRAASMGCLGAVCLAVGRRAQAMSALAWTVLGAVVLCPSMAVSYGFALSVAAVAGIVMFAPALTRMAKAVLPSALAQPCAVTVAAQALSLPIQVMMGTGVPLCSVPANAIVAPFVDAATICGLASFAVSWCLPSVGFALAWLASGGTAIMERCAAWLGGSGGVYAWPDGVAGGLVLAGCEVVAVAVIALAARALRAVRRRDDDGTPVGRVAIARQGAEEWWRDVQRDVIHAQWDEGRGTPG